jgi:hypothetical protein
MPPVIYTDLSWSAQPRRWIRTLQVVAIAGLVGAVGGGAGAIALVGLHTGSSHLQFGSGSGQVSVRPPTHAVLASPQSEPALAAQPQPATPAPAIAPAPPSPPPSPSRLATVSSPPAIVRSEGQLAIKGLYDHTEPLGSNQAEANRSLDRPVGAPARAKRSSKRVSKSAPLVIRPPRGPVLSEDGDWRDDYRGNWGGGFFGQDDWRN